MWSIVSSIYIVWSAAVLKYGIRNPESGIRNPETEYGICERRFQAIDFKKNISNDNKINKQIKKKDTNE